VLAAAGVLDGRRATTHWAHTGRLTEEESVASTETVLAAVREAGYDARIASHATAPAEETAACGSDCCAPAAATLTRLAVRSSA
jgi:hypothetical protein